MYNQTAYELGSNRSVIRELFEYGRQRAAIVGAENIFDYSLGNPSIPAPKEVEQAIRDILSDTPSLAIHGYTSAIGDADTRKAIADDLNARYNAGVAAEDLFIGCGAVHSRRSGSGGGSLFPRVQALRQSGRNGTEGRSCGYPRLPDRSDRGGIHDQ